MTCAVRGLYLIKSQWSASLQRNVKVIHDMGSSGNVTPGLVLSGFSWLVGWSSPLPSDMLSVEGALVNSSEAER